MKFLLVLVCISFSLNAFAQPSLDKLKPEDFLSDFDLAISLIKRNHPNPYKFISENEFDKKVDSLRKGLQNQSNVFGFIAYSPTKLIKDVHMTFYLHDDLGRELYKKMNYFPYPMFVEKGRVFVNIKEMEVPFGAEILAINDQSISSILSEMSYPVDGKIPSVDNIPNLAYSVSLRNSTATSYKVDYIVYGDPVVKSLVVKSIGTNDYAYRNAKMVYPYNLAQTGNGAIYGEFNSDKGVGVLTVNSFDLSESYAYKEFGKFFKEVNAGGFKKVIIDVRSNAGGDPSIAALLFSFLTKHSFSNEFKYKTGNISWGFNELMVDNNSRKLSEEDILNQNSFFYQRFDKDSTGGYVGNARLMEGIVSDFPRDKDAFDGEVRVLIGSGTISAATYFASLVKKNKRGVIIGKETSSGVDATTAAWFNTYELPKTRTSVVLPLSEIYFFDAVEDKGRGLLPDVQLDIERFVKDVLNGRDPEMSYALEN